MNEIDILREYLSKPKPKKTSKAPYRKPESVKDLERLHFEWKQKKHPDLPFQVQTKFRDDSANELTKCVTAWLTIRGYFAGRVNTTGTYSQKLGKYIHSGSKRGMADVTAVVNGRHVSIEVKYGKDRIRLEQSKVKAEIESAGGKYLVVSSFDDFLKQIASINKA